jgi:hypothetical protein
MSKTEYLDGEFQECPCCGRVEKRDSSSGRWSIYGIKEQTGTQT